MNEVSRFVEILISSGRSATESRVECVISTALSNTLREFWIDAVDLPLIIVVRLLDEVINEHRQILQAISKRREVNGARVQAIEKVCAQAFLADRLLRRPIRRCEKSNIDLNLTRTADRKHSALLNDA